MKIKIKTEQNSSSQTRVVSIQYTGGGDSRQKALTTTKLC